MKSTRYIILIGFVCGLLIAACGKDEPATEDDAVTRGTGVQDSTKGGGGIKLDTTWRGDTTIYF